MGGIIDRHKLSAVVADNEAALMKAMDSGDYIQVFLVAHTLIESYLREFLSEKEEETRFSSLISKYKNFLKSISYPVPTFVTELTEFNCRRNRITHQLWRKGFTKTNEESKDAAGATMLLYSQFVQWLLSFGFTLENSR